MNDVENLILENDRLVFSVLRKYRMFMDEDLISVGRLGLVKAANTFDESKGYQFSTYAIPVIYHTVAMYLRHLLKHKNTISLNSAMFRNENDGDEISLEDILADNENVEESYLKDETFSEVMKAVDTLSEREKTIISMMYGLNGYHPTIQAEIAKDLGLSQSYVSRIAKNAIDKLRAKLMERSG